MSDTATSSHADVTAVRRNPGIGHHSGMQCARCHFRGQGLGWASLNGLLHCPACREKQLAKRAAKKANA